uniref:Uncharacterized protein n=1 Tax=Meloidogyne enterolobii TaxID=390850 RepID=A0A6V7TPX7_MELEN|nr:unnamed protein product [Meloidogyne enterolobii]
MPFFFYVFSLIFKAFLNKIRRKRKGGRRGKRGPLREERSLFPPSFSPPSPPPPYFSSFSGEK